MGKLLVFNLFYNDRSELHRTHHILCEACQSNKIDIVRSILDPSNPIPVDVNMKL